MPLCFLVGKMDGMGEAWTTLRIKSTANTVPWGNLTRPVRSLIQLKKDPSPAFSNWRHSLGRGGSYDWLRPYQRNSICSGKSGRKCSSLRTTQNSKFTDCQDEGSPVSTLRFYMKRNQVLGTLNDFPKCPKVVSASEKKKKSLFIVILAKMLFVIHILSSSFVLTFALPCWLAY